MNRNDIIQSLSMIRRNLLNHESRKQVILELSKLEDDIRNHPLLPAEKDAQMKGKRGKSIEPGIAVVV